MMMMMMMIIIITIIIIIIINNNKQSELRPQRVQTPSCLRVETLEIVRGSLAFIGEQNGDPLRAKPTHYMSIYDGTNKIEPKEITQHLFQDVCFLVRGHARE